MSKIDEIKKYIQDISLNRKNENLKLPTEKELSIKFKCSRATIVGALNICKNQGLIYSIKGSGWYITKNRNSIFLKSVSEYVKHDHKNINIFSDKEKYEFTKYENLEFNISKNHIIKVEYILKNKLVCILILFVKKWEIMNINIDDIKESTNSLYKNKLIGSIEYNVSFKTPNYIKKYQDVLKASDVPIVNFKIFGQEDNIVTIGYIIQPKEIFNFEISKTWI